MKVSLVSLVVVGLFAHSAMAGELVRCSAPEAVAQAQTVLNRIVEDAKATSAAVLDSREDGKAFYFTFTLSGVKNTPKVFRNRPQYAFVEVEKLAYAKCGATSDTWGAGSPNIFVPKDTAELSER